MKILAVIKNLIVRAGGDFSGLGKETRRAQKNLNKFRDNVNSTMRSIRNIIITVGIGKLIKDSISAGMDAIESESLFEVSMGNMTSSARAWSEELQKTLGLNAYEIRKNVGVLYNMTTSMGLTRDAAYKLSTEMTELAYDMASFYNIDAEEAFTKLRAGITGETEPLKRLGILIDEATIKQVAYRNGIATVGKELTQQQKVQARYIAIIEQTANAQGDLARTIDSPTNQLRLLTTRLKLVQINIGMAFMPIAKVVLPILNQFAATLITVTNTIAQFMQALFGKDSQQQAQATATQASAVSDLGNAYKTAGKQAKGALAGFDEINSLADSSGSGSGADILGGSAELEAQGGLFGGLSEATMEVSAKVKEMTDKVKAAFGSMSAFIVKHKNIIIPALAGIAAGFTVFAVLTNWSKITAGFTLALKGLAAIVAGISLPFLLWAAAAALLVAGIVYLWQTNEGFRNAVIELGNQIKQLAIKFKEAAIQIYNEFIVPLWDYLKEKLGPVFAWMAQDMLKSLNFVLGIAIDVAKGLITSFGGIIDFVAGVFTGDWKRAWEGVKNIFKGVFDSLYTIVKVPLNLIIDAVNKVIKGLNKLEIKVPSWVSKITGLATGSTWGFSIPQIPRLAQGGITNGPMMAMIGDNPGGKEVVSPLDDLKDIIASAVSNAVISAMQFGGGSAQGDVILQLDGTTIARLLSPYNTKESSRIGKPMITAT